MRYVPFFNFLPDAWRLTPNACNICPFPSWFALLGSWIVLLSHDSSAFVASWQRLFYKTEMKEKRSDLWIWQIDNLFLDLFKLLFSLCKFQRSDPSFSRLAIQQRCYLLAGSDDRLPGFAAVIMGTRGIAEFFLEKRPHSRNDFRVMGGGGVIIQIDRFGHER